MSVLTKECVVGVVILAFTIMCSGINGFIVYLICKNETNDVISLAVTLSELTVLTIIGSVTIIIKSGSSTILVCHSIDRTCIQNEQFRQKSDLACQKARK